MLCNRHTTKEYVYNITSNFPETFIQSDLHTLQYQTTRLQEQYGVKYFDQRTEPLIGRRAHLTPEPQPLTL